MHLRIIGLYILFLDQIITLNQVIIIINCVHPAHKFSIKVMNTNIAFFSNNSIA